jgi:hypothetical protein
LVRAREGIRRVPRWDSLPATKMTNEEYARASRQQLS